MNRANFALLIFSIFIIFLMVITFFLNSEIAINGITVANLNQQYLTIRSENEYLKSEIIRLTTLTHIRNEAIKLGFIPAIYYYVW